MLNYFLFASSKGILTAELSYIYAFWDSPNFVCPPCVGGAIGVVPL